MADRERAGDEAILWAIGRRELRDPDAFDAYLADPLIYALGLKQLGEGAAEQRARRLVAETHATSGWWADPETRRWLYVGGGVAGGIALGWLARRRREAEARPERRV